MRKECENADCLECEKDYEGKSACSPTFYSGDECDNVSKEEFKKSLLRIGDFMIYLIAYFLLFYIPICFFVQTYQNIVWLIGLFK